MTCLVLVHGIYFSDEAGERRKAREAGGRREEMFAKNRELLGVLHYEWVDGRKKALANHLLRLARGTAEAVDAVELIELDETAFRNSLGDHRARIHWHKVAGCAPSGLDARRSFILLGAPRRLLDGPAIGQRLFWFGKGLGQLSEDEFIAHYIGHHGPLVASYAPQMGLRRYWQVPGEQAVLCDELRKLGLGEAPAPAVFAELVMGPPPVGLASLRIGRRGAGEIKTDEKRHIDFSRSMLLLV